MQYTLKKLTSQQISAYWNDLRPVVLAAAPPQTADQVLWSSSILQCFLSKTADMWMMVGENGNIYAAIITTTIFDAFGAYKSLLIYSLYVYERTTHAMWESAMETLKQYAADKGCTSISAYTTSPEITEIARLLGADTSTTYLIWRIQ